MNFENYKIKVFDQLTNTELLDILRLRLEIFIVEQVCPYPDIDEWDKNSVHFFSMDQGHLIAYTRIQAPGVKYSEYCSIGRVVSHPSVRGKGFGEKIFQASIDYCTSTFGKTSIKIEAQYYLKGFYKKFGFQQIGFPILVDGIPHIEMIKSNF